MIRFRPSGIRSLRRILPAGMVLAAVMMAPSPARLAAEEGGLYGAVKGGEWTEAGLDRVILDDMDWLDDADRLMDELRTLDVRMYTLIHRAGSEESRNALIRERSNIRRLIVELTEARNSVYDRLDENRRLRDETFRSAGLNHPVGY